MRRARSAGRTCRTIRTPRPPWAGVRSCGNPRPSLHDVLEIRGRGDGQGRSAAAEPPDSAAARANSIIGYRTPHRPTNPSGFSRPWSGSPTRPRRRRDRARRAWRDRRGLAGAATAQTNEGKRLEAEEVEAHRAGRLRPVRAACVELFPVVGKATLRGGLRQPIERRPLRLNSKRPRWK